MKCICEMCGQVMEPLDDQPERGNGTITPDELASICKTVVELADIQMSGVNHTNVKDFAIDCFGQLLANYAAHKRGHWRIGKKGEAV